MSRENVIKFYEEVRKNENLKREFENLKSSVENAKGAKDESIAKQVVAIARKNNFDFTEKELLDYMEKVKETLSEEELLNVSGGKISARTAGIGLMGTLMLSFGTGAVYNLIGSQSGSTQTQHQEATLNNEDQNENDSDFDKNTTTTKNKSAGTQSDGGKSFGSAPSLKKMPADFELTGDSMPSGRSVTRQSKLGRNLVAPQGETPTLSKPEQKEEVAPENNVRPNSLVENREETKAAAPDLNREVSAAKPETDQSETTVTAKQNNKENGNIAQNQDSQTSTTVTPRTPAQPQSQTVQNNKGQNQVSTTAVSSKSGQSTATVASNQNVSLPDLMGTLQDNEIVTITSEKGVSSTLSMSNPFNGIFANVNNEQAKSFLQQNNLSSVVITKDGATATDNNGKETKYSAAQLPNMLQNMNLNSPKSVPQVTNIDENKAKQPASTDAPQNKSEKASIPVAPQASAQPQAKVVQENKEENKTESQNNQAAKPEQKQEQIKAAAPVVVTQNAENNDKSDTEKKQYTVKAKNKKTDKDVEIKFTAKKSANGQVEITLDNPDVIVSYNSRKNENKDGLLLRELFSALRTDENSPQFVKDACNAFMNKDKNAKLIKINLEEDMVNKKITISGKEKAVVFKSLTETKATSLAPTNLTQNNNLDQTKKGNYEIQSVAYSKDGTSATGWNIDVIINNADAQSLPEQNKSGWQKFLSKVEAMTKAKGRTDFKIENLGSLTVKDGNGKVIATYENINANKSKKTDNVQNNVSVITPAPVVTQNANAEKVEDKKDEASIDNEKSDAVKAEKEQSYAWKDLGDDNCLSFVCTDEYGNENGFDIYEYFVDEDAKAITFKVVGQENTEINHEDLINAMKNNDELKAYAIGYNTIISEDSNGIGFSSKLDQDVDQDAEKVEDNAENKNENEEQSTENQVTPEKQEVEDKKDNDLIDNEQAPAQDANEAVEVKSVKTKNWYGTGKYYDLDVTVASKSNKITLNQELINEIATKHKIEPEVIRSITMVGEGGQAVYVELGEDLAANLKAAAKNEGDNKVTINNGLFEALNARDEAEKGLSEAKSAFEKAAAGLDKLENAKKTLENKNIIKYFNAIEKVTNNHGWTSEWDLYVTMKKDSRVEVPQKGAEGWNEFLLAVQGKLNNKNFSFENLRSITVDRQKIAEYSDKTGRESPGETKDISAYLVLPGIIKNAQTEKDKADKKVDTAQAKLDAAKKALSEKFVEADAQAKKTKEDRVALKKENEENRNMDLNDFWTSVGYKVEVKSVETIKKANNYHDLKVTVASESNKITLTQELINEIATKRDIESARIHSITMLGEHGQAIDVELGEDLAANLKAAAKNEGDNKVTINNELFEVLNAKDEAEKGLAAVKKELDTQKANKDNLEKEKAIKYFNLIKEVQDVSSFLNWSLKLNVVTEDLPDDLKDLKDDENYSAFMAAARVRYGKEIGKLGELKLNGQKVDIKTDTQNLQIIRTRHVNVLKDNESKNKEVLAALEKASDKYDEAQAKLIDAEANLKQTEQKYFNWKKLAKEVEFESKGNKFTITRYYVEGENVFLDIEGPKGGKIDIDDLEKAMNGNEQLRGFTAIDYTLDVYVKRGVKFSAYDTLRLDDNTDLAFKLKNGVLRVKEMTGAQFQGQEKDLVKKAVEERNKLYKDKKISEDSIRAIQVDSLDGNLKYFVKNDNGDFVDIDERAAQIKDEISEVTHDSWASAGSLWKLHVKMKNDNQDVQIDEAFLKALDIHEKGAINPGKLYSIEITSYGHLTSKIGGTINGNTITFSADEMAALGEKALVLKVLPEGSINFKKVLLVGLGIAAGAAGIGAAAYYAGPAIISAIGTVGGAIAKAFSSGNTNAPKFKLDQCPADYKNMTKILKQEDLAKNYKALSTSEKNTLSQWAKVNISDNASDQPNLKNFTFPTTGNNQTPIDFKASPANENFFSMFPANNTQPVNGTVANDFGYPYRSGQGKGLDTKAKNPNLNLGGNTTRTDQPSLNATDLNLGNVTDVFKDGGIYPEVPPAIPANTDGTWAPKQNFSENWGEGGYQNVLKQNLNVEITDSKKKK